MRRQVRALPTLTAAAGTQMGLGVTGTNEDDEASGHRGGESESWNRKEPKRRPSTPRRATGEPKPGGRRSDEEEPEELGEERTWWPVRVGERPAAAVEAARARRRSSGIVPPLVPCSFSTPGFFLSCESNES